MTLIIAKIELKMKKLRLPQVGRFVFIICFLDQTIHSLFMIPSKKSLNIILLPLKLEDDL
jgi:hypothetical protein